MNDKQIIDSLLNEFYSLCEIPHTSKYEKELSDFLKKKIEPFCSCITQDELGNIYADIPPTKGFENMPKVALQAHIDMVYSKGKNAPKDGTIKTKIKDGYLSTDLTSSLGADCGIGICAILWLLQNANHCPLKIILTVQEEIGLIGACKISPECVKDVEYFINLDGFKSDVIVNGSCGGLREQFSRPLSLVRSPAGKSYKITISDLKGGHSGFDIDKNRANAVLILGEILRQLQTKTPFAVSYIKGGEAFNSIPHSAKCKIITAISSQEHINEIAQNIMQRYKNTDPEAKIKVEQCEPPENVWSGELLSSVLTVLGGFANGVYNFDENDKKAVRNSSNLGKIYDEGGELSIETLIRYMDDDICNALHQSHILVAGMCGFISVTRKNYPAWQPDLKGKMLCKISDIYKQVANTTPKVVTQHVGLEPSYFKKYNDKLECLCMGFDIYDCHCPSERLKLETIPTIIKILSKFIENP